MQNNRMQEVLKQIGELVEDAAEETFILFSQDLPHNDLGIVDDKASELSIEINGHEYSIAQSSSLLRSSRVAGTTGAMVWKVTPRMARWLTSKTCPFWERGLLDSTTHIVELGCGVAGIIGMTLCPLVASYVLTDQSYVLKLLKDNISNNTFQPRVTKKHGNRDSKSSFIIDNLHTVQLDWEHDSVQNLKHIQACESRIDVVIICDCIYNSFLIEPLTQTCIDISKMNPETATLFIIAQQLRTDDVFEEWLTRFQKDFDIWRVQDALLAADLRSGSGYVVHCALLRSNKQN